MADEKTVDPKPPTVEQLPLAKAKALGLAFVLLLSVGAGFGGGWLGGRSRSQQTVNTAAQQQIISSESQLISGIAKKVGPSVVSVATTSQSVQPDFFGFARRVEQQSAGTGIILTTSGIVMTNRHVV